MLYICNRTRVLECKGCLHRWPHQARGLCDRLGFICKDSLREEKGPRECGRISLQNAEKVRTKPPQLWDKNRLERERKGPRKASEVPLKKAVGRKMEKVAERIADKAAEGLRIDGPNVFFEEKK